MNRLPLTIGMLGAGLLIGVLSPGIANASDADPGLRPPAPPAGSGTMTDPLQSLKSQICQTQQTISQLDQLQKKVQAGEAAPSTPQYADPLQDNSQGAKPAAIQGNPIHRRVPAPSDGQPAGSQSQCAGGSGSAVPAKLPHAIPGSRTGAGPVKLWHTFPGVPTRR